MPHYADSSFLVSSYLIDANTKSAHDYLQKLGEPLIFTLLHALEIANAFELALFRKLVSPEGAAIANQSLADDLKNARLIQTTVRWPDIFRLAEKLSKLHTAATGSRSLDILHVAAAKKVKAGHFVSF